jgi:hypothetical protein
MIPAESCRQRLLQMHKEAVAAEANLSCCPPRLK